MGKNKELYDEIVRIAYGLYEQRGNVHGHDLEDWLGAERIVLERHGQEMNTQGSTKEEKASGTTEPNTLKASKRTPGSSSQARIRKSPPKKLLLDMSVLCDKRVTNRGKSRQSLTVRKDGAESGGS